MANAFLTALLEARMENPAAIKLRKQNVKGRMPGSSRAVHPIAQRIQLLLSFILDDKIHGKNTKVLVHFLPLFSLAE